MANKEKKTVDELLDDKDNILDNLDEIADLFRKDFIKKYKKDGNPKSDMFAKLLQENRCVEETADGFCGKETEHNGSVYFKCQEHNAI